MVTYRQSERKLVGDEWNLGELTGLSAEAFWNWAKTDTTGYDRHPLLFGDKCVDFRRELWFELGELMCRKHWSVYQDHMKYIQNDIVMLFIVKLIRYSGHVREIHDLSKYLPPPLMKVENAKAYNLNIHNQ